MDAESSLLTLAVILMGVGLVVSFIPLVPASLLMWLIGSISAYLDNFNRVPVVSVIAMTVLMPMTTPRIVRAERILLVRKVVTATATFSWTVSTRFIEPDEPWSMRDGR